MQALPDKRADTEFVMLNGAHAVASALFGTDLVLAFGTLIFSQIMA